MDQLTTEGTEKSEATKKHKKHKRFINSDRGFSLTVCASCAFSWLILFVLLCALCGKKVLSFRGAFHWWWRALGGEYL